MTNRVKIISIPSHILCSFNYPSRRKKPCKRQDNQYISFNNVPQAVFDEVIIPGKPETEILRDYLEGKIVNIDLASFVIGAGGLGRGELEAMALYKKLQADFLLIDDKRARKVARLNNIEIIGSQGVLLFAKQKGLTKKVKPFLDKLRTSDIHINERLIKKLSGKKFTLMAQDLTLELGKYNAKYNTYPVAIKAKKPYEGVLIACNADIPIPRQEARVFKQHFANNILRPEISGNFQSTGFFRVAQAYVIDDATNKKYDLFASKFVDLGNGIVYDSRTKLLWVKAGNYFGKQMTWHNAKKACEKLVLAGLSGWHLPTINELESLVDKYYKPTINPVFSCESSYYWSSTASSTNYAWRVHFSSGNAYDRRHKDKSPSYYVRAVRGGQ